MFKSHFYLHPTLFIHILHKSGFKHRILTQKGIVEMLVNVNLSTNGYNCYCSYCNESNIEYGDIKCPKCDNELNWDDIVELMKWHEVEQRR